MPLLFLRRLSSPVVATEVSLDPEVSKLAAPDSAAVHRSFSDPGMKGLQPHLFESTLSRLVSEDKQSRSWVALGRGLVTVCCDPNHGSRFATPPHNLASGGHCRHQDQRALDRHLPVLLCASESRLERGDC